MRKVEAQEIILSQIYLLSSQDLNPKVSCFQTYNLATQSQHFHTNEEIMPKLSFADTSKKPVSNI